MINYNIIDKTVGEIDFNFKKRETFWFSRTYNFLGKTLKFHIFFVNFQRMH